MPRNSWDIDTRPYIYGTPPESGQKPPVKPRTLGIRDKQILYERAKGKCEVCGKKIEFSEMQTGHKTAASKGGSATLRNSVCLCYKHNKLQGTDSWDTFIKKMGRSNTRSVTSGKKRSPSKKKGRKKKVTERKKPSSKGNYWISPLTGKRERIPPLFRL